MTYSRYNPFKPNSPIFSGMFAGRTKEISRIDEILYQTKLGNPSHILITGIRGIGKSSLLLVANHFAKGLLTWKDAKYNFLTVQISISNELALIDVIRKINMSMKRELEVYEPGKALFEKFWKVIQKVEIGGLKYRTEKQDLKDYELIDEFSFFISDTVKSITDLISLSDSER